MELRTLPEQTFKIHMVLEEDEARALDALVGYGGKAFVENFLPTFYDKLGKHYMKPHEKGLIKLFDSIRTKIPAALRNCDEARNLFKPKPNP